MDSNLSTPQNNVDQSSPLFSQPSNPDLLTPLFCTPNRSSNYYRFPLSEPQQLTQDIINPTLSSQLIEDEIPLYRVNSSYLYSPLINGFGELLKVSNGLEPPSLNPNDKFKSIDSSPMMSSPYHNNLITLSQQCNNSKDAIEAWSILISPSSSLTLILSNDKDIYSFGRKKSNDFVLLESHISAIHFSIKRKTKEENGIWEYFIRDEGSTNGTYLNQIKIKRDEDTLLKVGDQIHILSKGMDEIKEFIRTSFLFVEKQHIGTGLNQFYAISKDGLTTKDGNFITKLAADRVSLKKVLIKQSIKPTNQLDNKLRLEYQRLKLLNHPYLIQPLYLYEEFDQLAIIFEEGQHGNLGQYLKRAPLLKLDQIKIIASQINLALVYLLDNNAGLLDLDLEKIKIIELDQLYIKLSNILPNTKLNLIYMVHKLSCIILKSLNGPETVGLDELNINDNEKEFSKDFILFLKKGFSCDDEGKARNWLNDQWFIKPNNDNKEEEGEEEEEDIFKKLDENNLIEINNSTKRKGETSIDEPLIKRHQP